MLLSRPGDNHSDPHCIHNDDHDYDNAHGYSIGDTFSDIIPHLDPHSYGDADSHTKPYTPSIADAITKPYAQPIA